MSDPTSRNRLDEEESPYLRQHADNPVNWQPWDEQARAAARDRDVPIFLSVGYAACHWCHVMEEESFEDESVAAVLNEWFVPIKVDREERPDVDRIYQTICQQVTGRGGWPLSVWLTPEGKPFYVGTYFPKEPRRNMPGFRQLLEDVHNSWSDPEDREEIENRAQEWTSAIEGELQDVPDQPGETPDSAVLEDAAQAAVRGADREHGGWGRGQKFPQTGRLHLLLAAHEGTTRDPFRAVATETLDAMADGGLYDHVGGGFHRYCTDREWVVPHFEKMLYDNGELPRAFLAGYQVTGEERYASVVRETFDFLQRELQHPEGGFYSTLDARSEGESGEQEEGAFYVWTPDDVTTAIEDDLNADLFADRFGITDRGNFEGETVLTLSTSVQALAADYDLAEGDVRDRLDRAIEQAFDYRAERPRPARDEKVLAGWNGLAISALAEGAIVLDAEYAEVAADALSFVRDHHWEGSAGPDETPGRLQRRWADGVTKIQGYLEDYAFLGRGAFDLFQATGEVEHLAFALDLARGIEAEFWDETAGTLYFTPADGESLVARPQEVTDQSTPSSAGVAASLLADLDHFVNHDRFGAIAEQVVVTHSSKIESNPLQHASLALAADRVQNGALELTLVADDVPASWRDLLADRYLPDRLLAWRPADEDRLGEWLKALDLTETPPIWADRSASDAEPTVYACRSFTCSPPKQDLGAALDWAAASLASGE
ncbi:thioredoxin domain-containing protein [Halobacteriales archaeon Cl-PHB]